MHLKGPKLIDLPSISSLDHAYNVFHVRTHDHVSIVMVPCDIRLTIATIIWVSYELPGVEHIVF